MNVVLYTTDFEAITVLDLPMWLLDQLKETGSVRIAVLDTDPEKHKDAEQEYDVVTVYLEKFKWRGGEKSVLVTDDEELALLLNPDWLPGQIYVVQSLRNRSHKK